MLIDEEKSVVGFGWNKWGNLGTIHSDKPNWDDQVTSPKVVDLSSFNKTVSQLFPGGYSHTILLTQDGQLLQLGDHAHLFSRNTPVKVESELLDKVVKVVNGLSHTIVLREDGIVVSFGDNNFHQTQQSD